MKTMRALKWTLTGFLTLGLVGCSVSLLKRGSFRREPAHVRQSDPEYTIVREAPPPPHKERRSGRPSRRHVWVDGSWHWDGRRYVWQPGHWDVPPREHARWERPRYEKHDHGYRYKPGRWRED